MNDETNEIIDWHKNNKWKIADTFYGKGELEVPHTLTWWEWDWHFPFLHKRSIRKNVIDLQRIINKIVGRRLAQ